jgi:predicted deacylase
VSSLEPDDAFEVGGREIPPGRRTNVELEVARLPTGTWVSLPVAVLRGPFAGPRIFISAAVHGDELNGVEIVRRLLPRIPVEQLRGIVIAVPIVNIFGFLHQDRYLPDRRDLNRSFPGSPRGSLAARLAHLFTTEIVSRCDVGIDLHTGSNHRTNLPQIRIDAEDPELRRLAEAFRAPLTLHSRYREGSLRKLANTLGCPVLLYEAGETLRFHRPSIRLGVRGILRVLHTLGMLKEAPASDGDPPTRFVEETHWTRASRGGILLLEVECGESVSGGQVIARITDTFSTAERVIRAPFAGTVVGLTTNPVVNRGDAVAHLAVVE